MECGISEHLNIERHSKSLKYLALGKVGVRCVSEADSVQFWSCEYLFRNGLSDAGD